MSVSQTRFYRPSVGNFITCSLIPRPSSIRCLTLLVLIIHPVLVGYQSILPVALSQSSHSSLYEALRSIFLPLLLIPPRTLFHVFWAVGLLWHFFFVVLPSSALRITYFAVWPLHLYSFKYRLCFEHFCGIKLPARQPLKVQPRPLICSLILWTSVREYGRITFTFG